MNVVVTTACDRASHPHSFSLCDRNKSSAWDERAGGAASSLHLGNRRRSSSTPPGAHWLGGDVIMMGTVQASDPWEAVWELKSCTHTMAKACASDQVEFSVRHQSTG